MDEKTIEMDGYLKENPGGIEGKGGNETEFIKIGTFSYDAEEKKEQRLILQSGHMLTGFSIVSVMLLATIPILLDYTKVSNKYVFSLLGFALIFLIVSLLGTIIAHWRYGGSSVEDMESIYRSMCNSQLADFNWWWLKNLNDFCNEKRKLNNKKEKVMKISTISFGFSILCILIYLIFFLINYDLYTL